MEKSNRKFENHWRNSNISVHSPDTGLTGIDGFGPAVGVADQQSAVVIDAHSLGVGDGVGTMKRNFLAQSDAVGTVTVHNGGFIRQKRSRHRGQFFHNGSGQSGGGYWFADGNGQGCGDGRKLRREIRLCLIAVHTDTHNGKGNFGAAGDQGKLREDAGHL